MPKLWNETIEAHRRDVRSAVLDAAWTLANERGPAAVTMSEVAERAGIGRATLYKYFPDLESIMVAWHERQIARHLEQLGEIRERVTDPGERLHAVLAGYAQIFRRRAQHHHDGSHGADLATLLHPGAAVADAQQRLHDFVRDVLREAATAGELRTDMTPDELATYCLHALTAASGMPSGAATDRLVALTLAGLRAG